MHQIGSGVLGPVYRARRSDGDLLGDRLFALKAFHVDLTPEQTIVFGDALQEMVELGLTHAAVVSPVWAGVADGVPCVACEYVAGESLDVRMRPRVPLAAEAALPYIVQIAEALDAAHARGLVHGALHLRDVLITPDGARVGGFGIVAALDRVGHRCPLRPPYAAPEQIAGAEWGEAADRYALAAVACELLTGRRAAAGGGMAGNVEGVVDAQAAPRLTALLNAALATDPAGRPPSAERLADDLAGALSWTGAAGVRRALAAADGDGVEKSGGSHAPGRAESDPAIAGGDPPVGEEPVVAAAGGTVMRKRRKRVPWRGKQSEVDWTDRALDLGPPVGRAGTGAGDAQAGGAAAREPVSAAGGDPIDAALGAAPGDGHDDGGDLDLRADADTLADVAEGLHAGLRDGRGTVAGAGPDEVGPDSDAQAADAYSPISVGELEARVEGGGARPAGDEPSEAVPEPRYATEGGEDGMLAGDPGPEAAPESPGSAETGDVDDDDGGFALTPEEGYDYGLEDEADAEDAAGEIFGRGPADQGRRLPVALVAAIGVAVAVTAFVIGLGWMGGGEDEAAAVIADQAGETAAADDPARAFSEAVVDVGGAATEPPAAPGGTGNEPSEAVEAPRGAGSPAPSAPSAPSAPPALEPSPAARVADPETPRAAPPPPAALPPPEPVVAEGRLLVRSMPPGAEVIVNGESRGTTPLALAELPYGPYEVEVILAGYPPRREQLMLDAGDPIGSLNADLAAAPAAGGTPAGSPPAEQVGIGSILAETRPPGAAVWLDQRLVGETPVSIPDVPAGAHRIEFRLDGYRTWTTTVEVATATQARVAASLDDAAR